MSKISMHYRLSALLTVTFAGRRLAKQYPKHPIKSLPLAASHLAGLRQFTFHYDNFRANRQGFSEPDAEALRRAILHSRACAFGRSRWRLEGHLSACEVVAADFSASFHLALNFSN
jgi:hypothetical protein